MCGNWDMDRACGSVDRQDGRSGTGREDQGGALSTDTDKAARLARVELFRLFDRKSLDALARVTQEVELERGTVLCEQGRVADACWVVVDGEAEVEIGGEQLVGVIGPGESIGEMGLLDHLPRSATVRARTDMVVYRIAAQDFERVLGASPLARGLLELLSRRIRQLEHGRSLAS